MGVSMRRGANFLFWYRWAGFGSLGEVARASVIMHSYVFVDTMDKFYSVTRMVTKQETYGVRKVYRGFIIYAHYNFNVEWKLQCETFNEPTKKACFWSTGINYSDKYNWN